MCIRGFLDDNYQEFLEYCGGDEIGYSPGVANLAEFHEWLSEIVKREEYESKKYHRLAARFEKEANWLAHKLAEGDFDEILWEMPCREECDKLGCDLECRQNKWREFARNAVEEESKCQPN